MPHFLFLFSFLRIPFRRLNYYADTTIATLSPRDTLFFFSHFFAFSRTLSHAAPIAA